MPENPSAQAKTGRSCSRKQGKPGKLTDTPELPRGAKTICIPFEPTSYPEVVRDNKRFRSLVDEAYAQHPELFPAAMGEGYQLHDTQVSVKLGVRVRRIMLKTTGEVYGICPSFVMPYRVGYTADVAHALFLQGFGVPFWALTRVFRRDDMYWYRLTTAVGRNSIAGTTVKHPESLPADLGTGLRPFSLRKRAAITPSGLSTFQAKRPVKIPSRHNAPPITPRATAGTCAVVQWRRTKLWMI